VFFGYGPSLLCAQYFEYRLRTCLNKMVIAVSDELSVTSMIDENSLLVFITTTGTFKSFEKLYHDAKMKDCDVAMVVEEYNTALFDQCDKIFWLSKFPQPSYLKTYEKSRTIFFIFFEEVVQKIQAKNRALAETEDNLHTAKS
jgi:DNA-binding MurR/RpiR family transcriptional regulator